MNQGPLLKELEDLRAKVAALESVQQDIKESQSRFEAIVKAFDGLIYICSPDHKVEFMNSRFIERTGRNPVGEDCFRALHDLEEVCPWCVNEEVFRGETVRWEVLSPKDERWYYVINTPIHRPDGTVSKMAMIHDITARKLSDLALLESESRYRQFIETASDIIYQTDSGGFFTFVNPVAARITGYSSDELIGRHYLELVHPEARERVARFYEIQFVENLADTYYEFPLLSKVGETVWVGQHCHLVVEDTLPIGLQAITRDITDRKLAEDSLEKERLRFRRLAEQAPFAMATISAAGRFVYINPKFQEMFGYDLSDIPMGRDWFRKAYSDRDYRHQVIAAWLEDLAKSGPEEGRPRVFAVTCKDGIRKIVHFRPVQLETGEHLMTCEDITDRVHAERALSEHASMMENILDNAADGLCVCHNTQEFPYVRFTHWNPRMEQITGYTLDEINASGWYQTMYPDPDTRRLAVERMARMRAGDDISAEEWVITTKDGTQKPLSISTSVLKEEDGRIHVLAIMQDIGQRKKGEAALKESEERFRSTFEQAAVGICHVSPEGQFLRVNQKLCDILGYTSDELLSLTFQEITHPDDLETDLKYVRHVLADEIKTYSMEKRYLRKNGTEIWANLTVSLTRDASGVPQYFISVVEDISSRKMAEESLRDSEDKYRNLVEESFDGIFVQKGTKIVFANSRLCEMLGYRQRELVGQDHWVVYHPDYQELARERAQARMRGEDVTSQYYIRLQKKDGTSLDGEIIAKRLTVGGAPGVQVWVRDVTERKRAEDALKTSEEKYRLLVDKAQEAIFIVQDGMFRYVNPATIQIMGYGEEEFLSRPFIEFIHPDDRDLVFGRHIQRLQRENPPSRYSFRVINSSGAIRWIEIDSALITWEGRTAILVFGTDITGRRKSEEVQRRLATAVEYAAEGVIITDAEGTIQYVNPALERMTGYAEEEILAQTPRVFKSGEQDAAFYDRLWKQIHSGENWKGQLINRRKDGSLYTEDATISPVLDASGKIVNFVGIKRDITDQLELSKQLFQAQKMEAIGTLAGGIAHDFNNLLQAILGYTELLLMGKKPEDPEAKKLSIILSAARDGTDLVSRILTFSRKAESRARPLDLNEVIRKIEKLLLRTLPKMIEIQLILGDDLKVINGDPAQIEQLLMNLAVNAQHAMPEGGRLLIETRNVSLTDDYLRTHLGPRAGECVLLTVSDNGLGMSPEVRDRIFEPFFTTKDSGKGTGLGLAIVHGIVSQHGGYIRCYSEPGVGTSFRIYFPVASTDFVSEMSVTREWPAFGTETILLVDDDDRVREMGRQMITLAGYTVLTASSGEEALEIYGSFKGKIALAIVDLIMPGMGGKRCMEEILRVNRDARVLITSGYSPNGTTSDALVSGARGFIGKPYDSREILRAIRKVLDKGRL